MGKASVRSAPVRYGRPPKELAGEVEERILDAARKAFLERGFEGASIDEIAKAARSGKPTIYARFPDKRALFTAVMRDMVARIEQFKGDMPAVGSIEERLVSAGLAVLRWILDSDRVGLMRLAIAEVHRSPIWPAALAARRATSAARLAPGFCARSRNPTNSGPSLPSPRTASRQRHDPSSIWSSCPSYFARCSSRIARRYAPRSVRTLHAALRSFLPPAGMTA